MDKKEENENISNEDENISKEENNEENGRLSLKELKKALSDETIRRKTEKIIDDMVVEVRGEDYNYEQNPSGVFINCILKSENVDELSECVAKARPKSDLSDPEVLGCVVDGLSKGLEMFKTRVIEEKLPPPEEEKTVESARNILIGFIKGAFKN